MVGFSDSRTVRFSELLDNWIIGLLGSQIVGFSGSRTVGIVGIVRLPKLSDC